MDEPNLSDLSRHGTLLDQLGDREPNTPQEAQAIIEDIRAQKGYLDKDTLHHLESIPQYNRDQIMRIVDSKRETEAAYTKSISEQLYSSKYRFLHEIIQNADDSSYTNALKRLFQPSLTFTISPSEFCIETNEDGFTRSNVEAICATGKGTKKATASDESIGEKGFGFKSVFSIADKVHIQSGVWSFCFKYRDGDDGLGMVTPLDEPPSTLGDNVTTRITLTLSKNARQESHRLLDAVTSLPDTTIFFLRKLKEIRITTPLSSGVAKRTIQKLHLPSSGKVSIIRYMRNGYEAGEFKESIYYTSSCELRGMPEDKRRKGRRSAMVDLAFPIDATTAQPKLSDLGQYLFAYLPLQRLPQIQFLIQSDFITSASRESVVDCPWNEAIRDGVAKLFAEAVEKFATDNHPLQYSWLEYVPTKPMENLWKPLYQTILSELQKLPILQTWQRRRLTHPQRLRRLPSLFLHNNKPLFEDLEDDIYLAPEYKDCHYGILNDLGASTLKFADFVDRVAQDLFRTNSRLKTTASWDLWHESFARATLSLLQTPNSAQSQGRLKRLTIIPLVGGGQWTGAPGIPGGISKLYFPCTNGVPIPEDISLHLIDAIAASNPTRKALYRALGVEECAKETVIEHIKTTHTFPLKFPPTFDSPCSHFVYLYNFHSNPEGLRSWIRVPIESGECLSTTGHLYFPSKEPYNTYRLLPKWFRNGAYMSASFLASSLVEAVPTEVRRQNLSWLQWLQRCTGARYHPPLLNTSVFVSSAEIHRTLSTVYELSPSKFVGTLQAHWAEYSQDIRRVLPDLKALTVPCMSGKSLPMESTFLPTPEIRSKLDAMNVPSDFPLLKLPSILEEDSIHRWRFLEELGVHTRTDLEFYKTCLITKTESLQYDFENIKEVYQGIARLASAQNQAELRELFQSQGRIFDPRAELYHWWVSPTDCVWDGPSFLRVKHVLKPQYSEVPHVDNLFTVFLQIPDYTVDDVLDHLDFVRDKGRGQLEKNPSIEEVQQVYAFLDSHVQGSTDWKVVREAFTLRRLVMGEDRKWYSLTSCIWDGPFALSDYQALHKAYPTLQNFFVDRLKVQAASPAMLVDDLAKMTKEHTPRISEIRRRLVEIRSMIAKTGIDESLSEGLEILKECKFLPMKNAVGHVSLVGMEDNFFILDHERYGAAFSEHAIFLDFKLDEVLSLHTLFNHFGLTDRYLSEAIKKDSSVTEGASEDRVLQKDCRAKAYAFYCCAAKFKSTKALRGETQLFEQLSHIRIFTSDDISTQLVLETEIQSDPIRVSSDRANIHHEVSDRELKVYVPADRRRRRACYRSDFPALLTDILDVFDDAKHALALILGCDLADLDEILDEQDIPHVDWVERPVDRIEGRPITPVTILDEPRQDAMDSEMPVTPHRPTISGPQTPQSESIDSDDTLVDDYSRTPTIAPSVIPSRPSQCARLVDHVARNERRVLYASWRPDSYEDRYSETEPARRASAALLASRKIKDAKGRLARGLSSGITTPFALGDLNNTVFEILSGLHLPNFSRADWKSTIRGELQRHARYADMDNWIGRETADIVYTDRDGSLTRYLRAQRTGDFPALIPADRNFSVEPLEYYLEVKTTTSACDTRFFMSNSQYNRMQNMGLSIFKPRSEIYVLLRVFDLTKDNIGLKIFVNPFSLRGTSLNFDVHTWTGKPRDGP